MAGSTCPGIAPLVKVSNSWGGSDGNWSTFAIGVGTPAQDFFVLPLCTSGETWVPAPQGCLNSTDPQSCAASRGVGTIDGNQSVGFQVSDSHTWNLLGLYQLSYENNLFGQDVNNATYGLDTINLGQGTQDNFSIPDSIVAGIATPDFWLGSVGLGISPSNFSGLSADYTSLLASMKSENLIPSHSFGYSAGAAYRNAPGSLVFGGYYESLFSSDTINYPLNATNETALAVRMQGIVVTNSPSGTFSPPVDTSGLTLALDSSVAEMWLPELLCEAFADAFGLLYDNRTDLYLYNTSTYSQLQDLNTQFTFKLMSDDQRDTANIVFPFSAFALEAGYPIYQPAQPYFPMRRATDQSQYVLGRAFMQEAYVVVDWDRQNFTVGQNSHSMDNSSIATICPPQPTKSHLTSGAIAGIVVGVVAAAVLLGVAGWFAWSRWKKRRVTGPTIPELEGEDRSKLELMSTDVHELSEPDQQLMSNPIYEMPAEVHELPGHPTHVELPSDVK